MRDSYLSDGRIQLSAIDIKNIWEVINSCLPTQGAIELQQDQAGKEHAWHVHDTDETIVVLDGALKFYWADGEAICKAGDVIGLPRGTRHGSIALEGGARYIIAFESVSFS